MTSHRFNPGTVHLLGLDTGDDLYNAISEYVKTHDINTASLAFLGAVRRASLRYYNQEENRYQDLEIDKHLEVTAGTGNVSLLDGSPFVHIHAAFADEEGRAFGGHVNEGTEVFALEVTVSQLHGDAPVRQLDETTGLMLWGPPQG